MKNKKPLLKVVATVKEFLIPEYNAYFDCPHCLKPNSIHDIDEENKTVKILCFHCKQSFKVKIPKFN